MNTEDWKNHKWYRVDPFYKDIDPALLNSVDIKRYVAHDCLINSSDFDDTSLKTASYELKLLGTLYQWEHKSGRLTPQPQYIVNGSQVVLAANSISYLWLEQELFLPEYIAARFNLHIRYVHRGLLLGTGPLIDPGFCGHLLIPLHNLTGNDYYVKGGDGLIWVEFTKLSRNPYWSDPSVSRLRDLIGFPHDKLLANAQGYFDKSTVTSHGGVQSAFRDALDEAKAAAERAEDTVRYVRNIGLGSGIAIAIAIVALVYQSYQLMVDATSLVQDAQSVLNSVHPASSSANGEESANASSRHELHREKLDSGVPVLRTEEPSASKERSMVRNATRLDNEVQGLQDAAQVDATELKPDSETRIPEIERPKKAGEGP